MTGRRQSTAAFDIYTPGVPGLPGANVMCGLGATSIGSSNEELAFESAAGLDELEDLSAALGRVAHGGSLVQEPYNTPFPTGPTYSPAWFYTVSLDGNVNWYRNDAANQPDGSPSWAGPKLVRTGWGGHAFYLNAGWKSSYYVDAAGNLYGNSHVGVYEGTDEWNGPKRAGWGWNSFKLVFSGGEHIIYGILPNGSLRWYKHKGAPMGDAAHDWEGFTEVGTGWQHFLKVFSGGMGIIYAIRQDGVLMRYEHYGYLDGTPTWGPNKEIGTGWQHFAHVIGSNDGVIYAFSNDGRILWYCYGERPPPLTFVQGIGLVEEPQIEPFFWEGPVTMQTGLPALQSAFAVLAEPFRGPA